MDSAGPSLLRRALAVLVLVVVAILAFRIVLGFISAVVWLVAAVVLLGAAVWAASTLSRARRGRAQKRAERLQPSASARLPTTHEDRVEAQMAEIKEQLRRQGRS